MKSHCFYRPVAYFVGIAIAVILHSYSSIRDFIAEEITLGNESGDCKNAGKNFSKLIYVAILRFYVLVDQLV